MTIGVTDHGSYCAGTGGGTQTGISITSGCKLLIVNISGYASAADTTSITSVGWGNGTSTENLTQEIGFEGAGGATGNCSYTWYLANPTTSYDRIIVTPAITFTEGLNVTWAALSSTGALSIIDSGGDGVVATGTAAVTLTGGSAGDKIFVHGSGYLEMSVDLNLQSQTILDVQNTTACNTDYYGHAWKDWSSGATTNVYAYYAVSTAILVTEAAGGYTLTADSANYTYTATAAGLLYDRKLIADALSYTYTPTDANLEYGRRLTADAFSYTYIPTDANLEYHHVLTAEAAAYTYTGTDAGLRHDRILTAESFSYTYTVQDATLIYTPVGGYTLTAESASYSANVSDVSLLHGRRLVVEAHFYAYSATDASLEYGRVLSAEAASYAYTPQDAGLLAGRLIRAESFGYTYTGQNATLTWSGESSVFAEGLEYTLKSDRLHYTMKPNRLDYTLT